MRTIQLAALLLAIATLPVLADPTIEQEGPLSPCIGTPNAADDTLKEASDQWAVEIATAFTEDEAVDMFNRMKQEHSDILGDFAPIVVEQCNLSMGNKPQYSARVITKSRDEADSLCQKLQQSGGSCLVQKD